MMSHRWGIGQRHGRITLPGMPEDHSVPIGWVLEKEAKEADIVDYLDAEPVRKPEIIASIDTLAQRLGVSIEHFAYTFGDLASFSDKAFAVARRRFRFIYSGLRGDNAGGVVPYALRRDAVTAQDPTALLGAFVEGAADFRYARAHDELRSWV